MKINGHEIKPYANLSGVDLSGADLSYADLSDADLRYADLRGAILTGADLTRANLSAAILINANLSGVDLHDTNLYNAIGLLTWQSPQGLKCICYSVKHEKTVMHKLGCFWGDTEQAVEAIKEKYGENSLYEQMLTLNAKALEQE